MPYYYSFVSAFTITVFLVAFGFVILIQESINSYISNVKKMIKLLAKSGYKKETIIKVVRFYDPPNNSHSEGSI